jgi:hypothetical protein
MLMAFIFGLLLQVQRADALLTRSFRRFDRFPNRRVTLRLPHLNVLVLVALVVATPSLSTAQNLDDDAVARAIKAGQDRKIGPLVSTCLATAGFGESMAATVSAGVQRTGSFNVTAGANAGRIAQIAADARRLYTPFSTADVGDALRIPMAFVWAIPQDPDQTGSIIRVASPIERIVLKSKIDERAVVQPETFSTEPVELKNLVGGSVTANSAVATFSLGAIRKLPDGDFDVVVITQNGERRCKVGRGDRNRVFP